MRYSYEFKVKCIKLYRQGKYPDTPTGISSREFHRTIRRWVRMSDACGLTSLKKKSHNKSWDPTEKYTMVAQVVAGQSIKDTALSNGINPGLLYAWIRSYRLYGYEGLVCKLGRKPKEFTLERKNVPAELTESEREELIRLRVETDRMRTEIVAIKKEIALREEQGKARLKAKKQRSSKNSKKPDTN